MKYAKDNHLTKYREIQRRTQLLYGVKNIKKLVESSP